MSNNIKKFWGWGGIWQHVCDKSQNDSVLFLKCEADRQTNHLTYIMMHL